MRKKKVEIDGVTHIMVVAALAIFCAYVAFNIINELFVPTGKERLFCQRIHNVSATDTFPALTVAAVRACEVNSVAFQFNLTVLQANSSRW